MIVLLESTFGRVLCICGIVCSTWVSICRGTSKRSVLVPGGDVSSVATRKGNIMCARTDGFQTCSYRKIVVLP